MSFVAKQTILSAIHNELQKELPELEQITPAILGMNPVQFRVAVDKLASEFLIEGAVIVTEGRWPIPRMVCLSHVRLTEQGICIIGDNFKVAM